MTKKEIQFEFFIKASTHTIYNCISNPSGLEEWFAVMKISIPVVLLDETLKFISRNYIDGKINNIN
jgi:uncharacterized protein YndB with AHSA1/START domain